MPHTELQPFIDAAKQRGAGDEFLASLLIRRGWRADDVYDALGGWWERTTGVNVPARGRTAENSRDAFLYLLAFSTLATWACALGSLWFRLIEHWLPDAVAHTYYNFRGTVTWQMAAIAVALPIYLLVMRVILRETRANPDRVESGVRKWLTYIALLLAAIGVVSDLICFVQYFLMGGLTLRFVLKCLTVLAICGSIFWYYLGFLRGRAQSGRFAGVAVAGAAMAFAFGLSLAGTPAVQRQLEADIRRVEDLRSLAQAISAMTALPSSLDALPARRPALRVADPQSLRPYEFIAKSSTEYELCATFSAPDETRSGFWSHPAGRVCFTFQLGRGVEWQ